MIPEKTGKSNGSQQNFLGEGGNGREKKREAGPAAFLSSFYTESTKSDVFLLTEAEPSSIINLDSGGGSPAAGFEIEEKGYFEWIT